MQSVCRLITLISLVFSFNGIVRAQTDDLSLAKKARSIAQKAGVDVWHAKVLAGKHRNPRGDVVRDILVLGAPDKVLPRLCKSSDYLYQTHARNGREDWHLLTVDRPGYTSTVAAVLSDPTVPCKRVPAQDYFDVHDPIEDNTLIAVYDYFKAQVDAGRVKSIAPDQYRVEAIRLSPQLPHTQSFAYSISVVSRQGGSPHTFDLRLKSGKFTISDSP